MESNNIYPKPGAQCMFVLPKVLFNMQLSISFPWFVYGDSLYMCILYFCRVPFFCCFGNAYVSVAEVEASALNESMSSCSDASPGNKTGNLIKTSNST